MESLFFEHEIVDLLFLHRKDLIVTTFSKIRNSSPPPAIFTTLARLSLFPHFRIADPSVWAITSVVREEPTTFTLLPSPIFPSSSQHQQYSGFSFLSALTNKLRIVFSEFQTNLQTDPLHLPKYVQLTKDDQFLVTRSLVDSEIIRELILFVKETLTTILTNISTIDNLIASLPSDSSPTASLVSGDDSSMAVSLTILRAKCEYYMGESWRFFVNVTHRITDPHKSSFQTIILDDPFFPDLILNSLKLNHKDNRRTTIIAISNISINYPWMKEQFIGTNLVGRMFETVDFVSLPLSESKTLFFFTNFIRLILNPIGDDEETHFDQYPLIRVSVFEPTKQFITFIFHNSDKFVLNDEDRTQLENHLCVIHNHIKKMELRSDEHDDDIVTELVKWEVRQTVEMENEEHFKIVFESILNRTQEWNRNQHERLKRREELLREEGWDDSFELRVVGIEVDTNQEMVDFAKTFRNELAFNAEEFW
ncbi:hypothetical protein BLNAU_20298 [Blattamonas nauphoetae]|uniref:Uncharacterized protein n=1 Tax=Blattamonas nauphoetae TaxID=2049346 RepID=A0ABQ9WZ26_9EUKA|nr:hypothetical protein BLNAU_20298 [Blattamonas nauphoetae]